MGPSDAVRRWFGHRPERWEEFRRRYREKLDRNAGLDRLLELAAERRVTLVFAACDRERNNAGVLQELLEERLSTATRFMVMALCDINACERRVHDDRPKRYP